jgi:hypothetical protein
MPSSIRRHWLSLYRRLSLIRHIVLSADLIFLADQANGARISQSKEGERLTARISTELVSHKIKSASL